MRRLVSASNPNFSCSVPILRRRQLHPIHAVSTRIHHAREREPHQRQRAHRRVVDDARRALKARASAKKTQRHQDRRRRRTRFPCIASRVIAHAPERRFRLASAANKLHALFARHRGSARAVTARRRRRRRRRTRSQHRGAPHACLARASARRGRAARRRCAKGNHLAIGARVSASDARVDECARDARRRMALGQTRGCESFALEARV